MKGASPEEAKIASLIGAAWASPATSDDVANFVAEVSPAAPGDSRVQVAAALVELKQRRFDAALAWFDQAASRKPGDMAAWRGRIWTSSLLRKFDTSLAHAAGFAKIVPPTPLPEAKEAELLATLQLIGGVVGYVGGPGRASIEPTLFEKYEKQIVASLSGTRLEAFEKGRSGVASLQGELSSDLARFRKEDAEDYAKKLAVEKDFRETERVRIASETEKLNEEGKKAKSDAEREVSEVDAELKPLQQRYRELENQARPIQQRIRELEGAIQSANAKAKGQKDDGKKRDFEREADRHRDDLERRRRDLQPLVTEGNRIEGEGRRLEVRKAQAIGKYQQIVAAINGKLREFQRTLSQFEKAESLAGREPPDSPRVRAVETRLGAFTTYQPYPLEMERQKLLDALSGQ